MQSVDHYALQTTVPTDIPPGDEPLTEIASADELQPTITEVDGPLPHFVPLDQSMLYLEGKECNDVSLVTPEELTEAAAKQETGDKTLANGTSSAALSLPVSLPLPDKRPEQKKSTSRSNLHKVQKQSIQPAFYGQPAGAAAPMGLPFYQDHSYSSMVHTNHLPETLPSSHAQTNPLLLQCHLPPAGYHITRPGLDEPISFQSCPCYLSHGFAPHSAPPYQHVYIPLQPGSGPFAPLPASQETMLLPEMYTAPRPALIPAQPYPHMEHIFPYDPAYQRHSFIIPYAVQEALTTLQPPQPTSAAIMDTRNKLRAPAAKKESAGRKRDLDGASKLGEDPSLSKKSKLEQPSMVPVEGLAMQQPQLTSAPPYYRAENMVPYIPTNFNSYYPPFLPTAANPSSYQQGPIPFYQQPLEPEKRQQSRRALFQYQGIPPTEDSLGVHPLEKTPQKISSPTSTSLILNSETESASSTQNSLTKSSDSVTPGNLRQNRVNIPPPISVPPHINNFIISDTL